MNNSLPVFNWSLKKLLATEAGLFKRARISILYTVLLLALVKSLIVLIVAYWYGQNFQLVRSLIAIVFYGSLLKLILISKDNIKWITHVMIWAGMLIIWSNVFITVQSINVITLQFIFMIMLSSFYLLSRNMSLFYSCASVLPVVVYLFLFSGRPMPYRIMPEELAAPGTFLIIILNFVTAIVVHYLYHEAFSATISEKESLNLQLKEAAEDARRYAQSKSDFLSTMSHELRTPLNAVIGMADLLLDNAHNEEQKEDLKILSFSALSLHALINNILDFNKLESGKLQLEAINVNLGELLRNTCSGLKLQAKEKGLDLILNIDESLKNQYVITDPTRITQIIYNLAGNGIKFTSKGNVTISLTQLDEIMDPIRIRFTVSDTGIGIPLKKQHTVFEPFIQASTSTTRNFGGTGLGLSIVKSLLDILESSIHLESVPGKGSTFYFDVDFKPGKPLASDGTAGATKNYDLKRMRVLLAEDNNVNVMVVRKLCDKWNVNLTVVENGREVIEELHKHPYDVILMDIHMPVMDGYQSALAIRQLNGPASRIPIIALTASVSNDIHDKIKEAGMNFYMGKPFNAKELYARLENISMASEKERE